MSTCLRLQSLRSPRWMPAILWLIASVLMVQSYGHFHKAEHFQIGGKEAPAQWLSDHLASSGSHAAEFHDCHLLDAATLALGPVRGHTLSLGLDAGPANFGPDFSDRLAYSLAFLLPPARAPPA